VDVRSSSFMFGQAVEKAPDLAREIVNRGHEAAAHGGSVANLAGGGILGIWTPVG
jgi:peptidoglycan/xylan/chitin deacetylase (PgdA/CDA1 family)